MHMDGSNGSTTFIDSSSHGASFSASGAAALSTAQFKFGTASLLLNGGDEINASVGAQFDAPSGTSYTVEAWVYVTGDDPTGRARGVISKRQPLGDTGWSCGLTPTGNPRIFFYSSSGGNSSGSIVMSENAWHYLAWVCDGSRIAMYVDGVLDTTISGGVFGVNSYPVWIGADRGDVEFMNGYIDEVRVTNGVARYSGSTMPVQSAAWPNF